ncbi:MAG TPA: TrpB-like pyridoxal phosphate-dependent enzyme [Thermoleophilia bacterium]|nr:TrpB-like pyridoxal phosphate-dependent enzyme [Thermoleophilia bacterium]
MTKKYTLDEERIPRRWYNIAPDFPEAPAPPLHPGTKQPAGPDDLAPIFPMGLIMQEASMERFIDIPDEVRDIYGIWRPTPLIRAAHLERKLGLPANVRIFYKYEGVSPSGSHKSNTAVAQAYYNREDGVGRIATETGAGQWGSALAMACDIFGIDLTVYMVKVSFAQKPYRRVMMELYGAEVHPSPTEHTEFGRKVLAEHPDSAGSLGIAISEALEDVVTHPGSKYSLGSVLNHVLLHQTVIGEEALEQVAAADAYPDVVIGCVGGGSSFAGIAFPFMRDKLAGKTKTRFVGVEPTACPSLTRGVFEYDFGDTGQMTPLLKMYTLGHDFVPPGIHAGGLRYHAMAPLISHAYHLGLMEAVAVPQTKVFEAARLFVQTESIVPAPESAHAILVAIDEAKDAAAKGEAKTILFNLTGHGLLDLGAYDSYLDGSLEDYEHPGASIKEALEHVPQV